LRRKTPITSFTNGIEEEGGTVLTSFSVSKQSLNLRVHRR
jgi:hypothetical protein